jgi:hypothetical protein
MMTLSFVELTHADNSSVRRATNSIRSYMKSCRLSVPLGAQARPDIRLHAVYEEWGATSPHASDESVCVLWFRSKRQH